MSGHHTAVSEVPAEVAAEAAPAAATSATTVPSATVVVSAQAREGFSIVPKEPLTYDVHIFGPGLQDGKI